MNTIIRYIVCLIVGIIILPSQMSGQIENKYGRVCFLDSLHGPKVLCSMGDLNMSTFVKMPSDSSVGTQPMFLCSEPNGSYGSPDNIIWIAFQAESTTLDLNIHIRACAVKDKKIGIQYGLLPSCDFSEERIICEAKDESESTKNLYTSDLVIGKIYYLFIDGQGGAVCEFRMQLNNSFTDYNISSLKPSISTADDTNGAYCQGFDATFALDMDFADSSHWVLKNDRNEIVLDTIMASDTLRNKMDYSAGDYNLIVYGSNPCNKSKSDTLKISIEAIDDEDFGTIKICDNCLGDDLSTLDKRCILQGTFVQANPNGDTIVGWRNKVNILTKGLIESDVILDNGCSFKQKVSIEIEPRTATISKDTFVCSEPFTYKGIEYNFGQELNQDFEHEFDGEDGCSRYVRYTVREFKFNGHISVSCSSGGGSKAEYIFLGQPNLKKEDIEVVWRELDNTIILDNVSSDGFLVDNLEKDKNYILELSLRNGSGCVKRDTFDTKDNKPKPPIIEKTIVVCSNQDSVKIGVPTNSSFTYVWSLEPNFEFVTYVGTDTIALKNPQKNFAFSVYAKDNCGGESEKEHGNVVFEEAPVVGFEVPSTVCVDEPFTVQYNGQGGLNLVWTHDNIKKISNTVYKIENEGVYTIAVSGSDGTCTSDIVEKQIQAVKKPDAAPTVTCDNSVANQLVFSWPSGHNWITGVSLEASDEIKSKTDIDVTNSQIRITNLTNPDVVNVKISFEYGADCGELSVEESCTPVICSDDASIRVYASNPKVCEGSEDLVVLNVENHQGGEWYYNETLQGVFDPSKYGVGKHTITYNYTLNGCQLSKSLVIIIYPLPTLRPMIEYPTCVHETTPAKVLFNPGGNGNVRLYVDDKEVDKNEVQLMPGDYNLKVESADGCAAYEKITVEDHSKSNFVIKGTQDITPQDSPVYSINYSDNLSNIKWNLDGKELCTGSSNCSFMTEVKNGTIKLCVEAVTDENCVLDTCLDIRVTSPILFNDPNVFSPNGDGVNDFLTLASRSGDINVKYLDIYNRYGNKIVHLDQFILTADSYPLWNGMLNGMTASQGVYMYIMQYTDSEGNVLRKKHTFTLLN